MTERNLGNTQNMESKEHIILDNQWAKQDITREIRNTLSSMKMKTQHNQTYGIQLKQYLE